MESVWKHNRRNVFRKSLVRPLDEKKRQNHGAWCAGEQTARQCHLSGAAFQQSWFDVFGGPSAAQTHFCRIAVALVCLGAESSTVVLRRSAPHLAHAGGSFLVVLIARSPPSLPPAKPRVSIDSDAVAPLPPGRRCKTPGRSSRGASSRLPSFSSDSSTCRHARNSTGKTGSSSSSSVGAPRLPRGPRLLRSPACSRSNSNSLRAAGPCLARMGQRGLCRRSPRGEPFFPFPPPSAPSVYSRYVTAVAPGICYLRLACRAIHETSLNRVYRYAVCGTGIRQHHEQQQRGAGGGHCSPRDALMSIASSAWNRNQISTRTVIFCP